MNDLTDIAGQILAFLGGCAALSAVFLLVVRTVA
jgi:hypothetical protein